MAAGKSVYTYVGYDAVNHSWYDILHLKNPTNDPLVNTLKEKINELKLTGIILDIPDLYVSIALNIKKYFNKYCTIINFKNTLKM